MHVWGRDGKGDSMGQGLTIDRRFTTKGQDVYASVEWSSRDSRITNPDGSVVFEMLGAEIPAQWSQVASDIMVSKYFRKAGVPLLDAEGNAVLDADGNPATGAETSARQVIERLASTWRWWGENNGYFASDDDAAAFEDELAYMLLHQMAAPNSPQWFNTGLNHKYGITGSEQGFWFVDPETEEVIASKDAYSRPAPHACFPEGTRISLRDGFKSIEKIEPGDIVLTHEGRFRSVTDTMQRQVEEDLVRMRITKLTATDLVATANHPILAVRKGATEPAWINAGDLSKGDYVVVGGARSNDVVPELIDLAAGLTDNYQVDKTTITTRNAPHRPTMRRYLDLASPASMRLLGRWLGDGSVLHESRDGTTSGIGYVFNAEDTEGIADTAHLMEEMFGVTANTEFAKGQQTAHLRYIRRPIGQWFSTTFGEGFSGKSIPRFVFDLPREHRIQLLVGLYAADGCIHRVKNYVGLNFDHSNRELAEGVWRLARSLGYAPSITGGDIRPGGTTPHYRVQISARDGIDLAKACGMTPQEPGSGREMRLADGSVAYPVSRVTRQSFFGTVYNFQVAEDESYVADGIVVHNCFINSVDDDLVNEGGIMDLWVREARLFKMGAGSGANFSNIRAEGEQLSGGGKSSGLMSFLKVGDRAAGAIKSGGTTRRAAKMVIVDIDHPDVETFIRWKAEEEKKVRALVASGFSADFNGEAYATVSGQNSNNSVRLSNDFLRAVLRNEDWDLLARTDGSVMRTVKARDLWSQIADAAWQSADPGLQFHGTINEWHTSPAEGEIRASNPCSEYMFLDNTACNLASLNLGKFYDDRTGAFDIASYQHAARLWTIVLEVSVTMAQFPSKEIAIGSYDYRTLGLGYANLGSLLMRMGIPYDSDHGRSIAGALTAILTGYSYATSAEMAGVLGPFPKYDLNRDSMLRVIRNHRRAAYNKDAGDYEGVSHFVMGIESGLTPTDMLEAARTAWDTALTRGEQHGFRNAQVSVLAPTGTIGLLMDCDTTGVEPDFSLVKFKKLAGGGYFKIANQSIAPALTRLGYSDNTVQRIIEYVVGTNSLARSPHINMATLIAKGFTAGDLDKIEKILPGVFEIGFAFNKWTLGEDVMKRLGFTPEQSNSPEFSMLKALGFTDSEIQEANDYICGRQTIEGAPHLRDEHLPVFDTANRNGRFGERYIYHTGHIKMMAAAQPFISGAISKTINMPNEVTREDIAESYKISWELGLKAMAIYRDGSKASQPLSSQSDDGYADDEPAELEDALVEEIELVSHGRVPWHETIKPGVSPATAYADMKRPRFLLPARRAGYTHEARVGGHKVFLRTGEYEDGTLGELFIDLAKEGATLRGILSCFAIAVSKGLQYGVPLEEYVDTFTFQTFEPRGMVEGHPNIKMANSLIDYVFRALGVEYLERDELAQVPPDRRSELPEPPKGLAVDAGIQLDLRDAAAETAVDATVEAAEFVDAEVVAPVDNARVIETSQDDYRNSAAMTLTSMPSSSNGGVATATAAEIQQQAMQASMADKMGDAPICENCGAITVRNGSCYLCLGCGGTTGCS
jgi:ribonucleoside-diphosphate reductase alpha chain